MSNERYCEVDAACWLVVAAGEEEIDVFYSGAGDAEPCANAGAYEQAHALGAGVEVELFAAVVRAEGRVTLSLCPEQRYYVRAIDPQAS